METGKALDAEAAHQAIRESDQNRIAFCRVVAGIDWNDSGRFHLVLDSEEMGPDLCAQRIMAEVKARFSHS